MQLLIPHTLPEKWLTSGQKKEEATAHGTTATTMQSNGLITIKIFSSHPISQGIGNTWPKREYQFLSLLGLEITLECLQMSVTVTTLLNQFGPL